MRQYNLNFQKKSSYTLDNFIISNCNKYAYEFLIKKDYDLNFIFLYGPKKSGKSHISNIWLNKYKSNLLNINSLQFEKISKIRSNILIDNVFIKLNEEILFYLINHLQSLNLKLLLTSACKPNQFKYNLNDLSSRIKSFHLIQIYEPDDYLITNLIVKLFNDRQIKIKNKEIINYITSRIERSFVSVYKFINKIDNYSLSNNREITIPLIKEII